MHRLIVSIFLIFAVASVFGVSSDATAAPSSEKGPRCSDGIDNDGDGLVDSADPDCGGDAGGEDPPPEMEFDGAACANSSTDFPALIYDVETIENEGHRSKENRYYDVYLANSDGSCSVHLYRGPIGLGGSYNQLGDHGFVVAHTRDPNAGRRECAADQIVSLSFEVIDKEVVTQLPLEFELVWESPICESVGVGDPVLSPDGSEIFFAMEEADPDVNWLDSLNVIDLGSCTPPNCVADRLYTWNNRGLAVGSINSTGSRIFLYGHDRVADTYAVAFVERDAGGVWSSNTKDIATDSDGSYQLTGFGEGIPSTALWAYGGDSIKREVLAFGFNNGTPNYSFDILDVQDCDVSVVGTSCYQDLGLSPIQNWNGYVLDFTDVGSADTEPDVIAWVDGSIVRIDPATGNDLGEVVPGVDVRPESLDLAN